MVVSVAAPRPATSEVSDSMDPPPGVVARDAAKGDSLALGVRTAGGAGVRRGPSKEA
jgi:hypothetical protein